MKLISVKSNGAPRTGSIVSANAFVDVSAAGDVLTIMTNPAARAQAQQIAASGHQETLAGATLLAPLMPRNLICLGHNYLEHIRETGVPVPTRPVIFAKFNNTIANPGDTITWYQDTTATVDYEAELGVIIGKTAHRVSKEDALTYVGGYTCVNDVSARDIQNSDSAKQWVLGKTPDGFCPIGPALVTTDDIPDPQVLGIRCTLNGQVMQNSNTKDMIFNVAYTISHISRFMTLQPGDLISTGTPPGVGMGRNPPLWMKDGDEVIVELEKIGRLVNKIRVL